MDETPRILFPGGRPGALTLSYDDGVIHDRTLVRLFNSFGIKATFHLNSGRLGQDGYLEPGEIRDLFRGHEVASHTATHPNLCEFDAPMIHREIEEDLNALSVLAGYPVRGFSYPFGAYNDFVASLLSPLGIAYARTVSSTSGFGLPQDFLMWHPTCHHGDGLMDISRSFRNSFSDRPSLLYVWGHSYEFHDQDSWGLMREFCAEISGDPSIWYATNIEICDYISNASRLDYSPDKCYMKNSGDRSTWVCIREEVLELKPGAVMKI